MKISMRKFGGIAPKIRAENLPKTNAVVAENCCFESLALTSTKEDIPFLIDLETSNETQKLECYLKNGKEYYAAFSHMADIIPAFENTEEKLFYFIGEDQRMYLYTVDQKTHLAGIPKPNVEIKATQDATHLAAKDNEKTAYRVSYVDGFGNEGGLSDPSNIISVSEKEYRNKKYITLTIKVNNVNPDYDIDPKNIKMRIYRSNTGSQRTYWQYLGTATTSVKTTLTYQDKVPSSELQEVAVTKNWEAPKEGIKHLITDGKGHSCIAYGNTVSISALNVPTSFPQEQQYLIPERTIVGLAAISAGILVFTNVDTYLLMGNNPNALSTTKLYSKLPCVSKDSIQVKKDAVIYASQESLVIVNKGECTEVTDNIIDRDTWQSLNPRTMVGLNYGNDFILRTDNGCMEFKLDDKELQVSTLSKKYKYITRSIQHDKYVSLDEEGKTHLFRALPKRKNARWRSKVFNNINHGIITCCRIIAQNYPIKLTIFIENTPMLVQNIPNDNVFRINVPRKSKKWQFQIEYHGSIYSIDLASSMSALVNKRGVR